MPANPDPLKFSPALLSVIDALPVIAVVVPARLDRLSASPLEFKVSDALPVTLVPVPANCVELYEAVIALPADEPNVMPLALLKETWPAV